MRYADLGTAVPERIQKLIWRNERLAQIHLALINEVRIEKDRFEYENMDNPVQVGNFYREDLSEEAKIAYSTLRTAIMAQYAIPLPNESD